MFCNRETRIYWLNWKEMFNNAEEQQDEQFFKLPAIMASTIEQWCGQDNLIEWTGDELCEEVGFDPTVMVHVRNVSWPWNKMIADLLTFSKEYSDMIFMVTFIEGQAEGKAYLCGGRLTSAIYNPDTGSLYLAF